MGDGALRMNQLLDTLLEFSRTAHVDYHHEKVDLSKMAEQIATDLGNTEDRADFRIAAGIVVDGDPELLRVA